MKYFLLMIGLLILENTSAQFDSIKAMPDTVVQSTSVPDSFSIRIPISFLDHAIDIWLKISKVDSVIANIEVNPPSPYFPKSFYQTLISNFDFSPGFMSEYYPTYYKSKEAKFTVKWFVGYKKTYRTWGTSNTITVVDVNNDSIPEIILEDLTNSTRQNPIYVLYRRESNKNKFILVPNFFNQEAFYGWDKSLKYLITGWGDLNRNRYREMNKVVGYKLVPIKKWKEKDD